MAGQGKWARLVGPSLIVVISASACGGTSIGEPSTMHSGGASGGDSQLDPPPLGGGGPIIGPGAGGGPSLVHPPCPAATPSNGSYCAQPAELPLDYSCYFYNGCGLTTADCYSQTWHLDYPQDCIGAGGEGGVGGAPPVGPGPLSCPAQLPATGSHCYLPPPVSSYTCSYGYVCASFLAKCTGTWLVSSSSSECGGEAGGYF
jgi:hypothetical protein